MIVIAARSTGSSSPASRTRPTTSSTNPLAPADRPDAGRTTGWSSSRTSPRYFLNSVIVTVGAIVPAVLVSFMAAYAIVRGDRSRFLRWTNSLFLMGLAIPLQATIIPVYLIIIRLDLYDTLLAIILPSIAFAIPLSVLVLTNFIRDVPKELFESMRTRRRHRVGHAVAPGASR